MDRKDQIAPETPAVGTTPPAYGDEKAFDDIQVADMPVSAAEEEMDKQDLQLIGEDLHELEAKMSEWSLERTFNVIQRLFKMHEHDQNFPGTMLDKMADFIANPNVMENPEKHAELIREMKMECILSTENSPYVEVRAVVDPTDDPSLPVLTIRAWVIGIVFSAIGSFVDTLFGYRNPAVYISSNVGQLLAYPAGKFFERVLPDWRFKLFGVEHSLNPGPFNQKEHMIITIMASVSFGAPYTNYIVPAQALPNFFNEKWAMDRGYQYLNTLGTTFVGYGLAGLTRRFLVFPSVAIWPSSLNTVGLIKAFHTEQNEPVRGPFGRMFYASREKCFLLSLGAMFIWYWFPGYIFQALSVFSWISWISPSNPTLDAVTGFSTGVGLNPWPTFDFNNLTVWLSPLTIPTFAIMNQFAGIIVGTIMTIGIYFTNAWNTSYMPINSNDPYDNTAQPYNVSKILDSDNLFNAEKYEAYSEPWMSAGFVTGYFWYFVLYSATLTYVVLFHRHDIATAFRGMWNSVKRTFKSSKAVDDDDLTEDVHYRLMRQNYKEVHEWQYFIVLCISIAIGCVGVGIYPTNTSPVVLLYGIIMPLIVLVPCGLIQAVTGIPVPLSVLAEFIGGSLTEGNANALMYFKTYGYMSAYQALLFSNDLKLAHYLKIAPQYTFWAQLVATLVYCIVSSSIFNFALSFKDICTPDAAFKFTCPNQTTFYSAAIFWGTISPHRLFGPGKRYNLMLLGFPIGVVIVLAYWLARRRWPKSERLRQIHPVMFAAGPSSWGSPYNLSYFIGNVYITWFSFQFIRKRYLEFWAKYNYIISAAFPAGIAFATIIIFFALEIPHGGYSINWWGNEVLGEGCPGLGGCPRFTTLPEAGYFGGAPGTYAL